LVRQTLEQLEGQPIWNKTKFIIFKAVHADQQAASVGVVTKRLAQQQKIVKKETLINLAFLVVVT
jgi:hypothetical protein